MVTGGGNGPYYMIRPRDNSPVSNFYLLAVLCHPISEAFIRTVTSTFRGGYYSHGKQFIDKLPIPLASTDEMLTIEGLVENLITANYAAANSRTPHQRRLREREAQDLKTQIEESVTNIFGLVPLQMELIHSVPVPI
jgi:hypothetical protein